MKCAGHSDRTATWIYAGPDGPADDAATPLCDECADEARPYIATLPKWKVRTLTPIAAGAREATGA